MALEIENSFLWVSYDSFDPNNEKFKLNQMCLLTYNTEIINRFPWSLYSTEVFEVDIFEIPNSLI